MRHPGVTGGNPVEPLAGLRVILGLVTLRLRTPTRLSRLGGDRRIEAAGPPGAQPPARDLMNAGGFAVEKIADAAKAQNREVEADMNPLRTLHEQGQSIWLDFLSRKLIRDGGLAGLVRDDGLTG